MKKFLTLSVMLLACLLVVPEARAVGFTDSDVTFYGEVRQMGGAQTVLLQAGQLEMTFVNQSNPSNVVTLQADLRPTGVGETKPYSYSLRVPLAYLPDAARLGDFLSIGATPADFRIENITIDGVPATLPDGSREFYGLSFASRAEQYRLDLLVVGDSTDSDGDGMPDWWEILHGLDPNLADATGDFDGDGWTNIEELRLGSNPGVSNRDPQIVTAEVLVPELGEAGFYVQILDSDTPPEGIEIELTAGAGDGFDLKLDGNPLAAGAQQLTLADIIAGRLSVLHRDRAVAQISLPISWNDGGAIASGDLQVRVVTASSTDGNDASLWLDGKDLPADGVAVGLWTDRSGNGRSASQPLAAHQAVVAEGGLDFGVSTSAHLFFQDVALPMGNHTILAAYRAAPASGEAQTLLSTNRGFMGLAPTSEALSYPGAPVYQMDGVAVRGYEKTAGAQVTSIFRREGALLQNIFGLSYDGESIAPIAIDPVLPTLGARRSAIPSGGDPVDEAFGGKLHELLVFPTALPEQKLRDVHDYLQSKWGGAVIWDLSTELRPLTLNAAGAASRQIIRGGHGADNLRGGPLDDTLSGGPGADILSGGGGANRFVFGGVDTGNDVIEGFDVDRDIVDLSALFWGQSGDARQFISVRLDANFSTPVPTLDSVLIVQRPDVGSQEIVLRDRVIGSTQLIQLIVEGRVRMGGLGIPASLQMALAPGSPANPLQESLGEAFTVDLTRSGAGVAAALEVPLGFFADALGGDFVVDEATSVEGRRAVVSFARGETHKVLTIRPVPDLETEGEETWQVAVLPHYKYAVGGSPVVQTVRDIPMIWLEVVQANAVAETAQPARVRIHRDGDVGQALIIDLQLGGSAVEGVHVQEVADSLTIPGGQSYGEVQVAARAEGLVDGAKVVLFQLASRERYQLGNPGEALLYAAITAAEANGAGFDRWLQTSTGGTFGSLGALAGEHPALVSRYLEAYALGLNSVEELGSHRMEFEIVDGRPELSTHGSLNAVDIRWGIESSAGLDSWEDKSGTFVEVADASGLKLVGEPLDPGEQARYYRLNLTLDPGPLTGSSIASLTGATRFGIGGNATWQTDQGSGALLSAGSNSGETSRIISEIDGAVELDFEMSIVGAGGLDSLTFYIDGIAQAATNGAVTRVQQTRPGGGRHLLMWEFRRGTGNAVIRNLAQ